MEILLPFWEQNERPLDWTLAIPQASFDLDHFTAELYSGLDNEKDAKITSMSLVASAWAWIVLKEITRRTHGRVVSGPITDVNRGQIHPNAVSKEPKKRLSETSGQAKSAASAWSWNPSP